MTINPVLKSVIAGEWGSSGIVSTDAGGVRNMVSKHKYFPTMREAVAACIKSGVNQFLDRYEADLRDALKRCLVNEADLDAALRGKYRVVYRLGLLDPPSRVPYSAAGAPDEPWQMEAHKGVARQVALESMFC